MRTKTPLCYLYENATTITISAITARISKSAAPPVIPINKAITSAIILIATQNPINRSTTTIQRNFFIEGSRASNPSEL